MHKIVDGKKVEISPKEEEEIRKGWKNAELENQQEKIRKLQAIADKQADDKQKIRAEILKMKEEGLL